MLRREEVIQKLQQHREQYAAFNVKSLSLFGSVARDEADSASDVDVLVEFDGPATYKAYINLKFFLEDLLGCSVDLVTTKGIRPEMADEIESETAHVVSM